MRDIPPRETFQIDSWMEEAFLCCWRCATPACRFGVCDKPVAYIEQGIEYVEAKCLRCGNLTRLRLDQID